ncbi:MAG: inositol monophosphatase family protein [Pseudomonadota bacterium]
MPDPIAPPPGTPDALAARHSGADLDLLPAVMCAVRAAGDALAARFDRAARPAGGARIVEMIDSADAIALAILRPALARARPGAAFDQDEAGGGALPGGEWWVLDPVEGAINFVHGGAEWGVTASLVRDNLPVLAVVYLPLSGDLYSAVRGHGAHRNGADMRVSAKTELNAAMVATGQAAPREDADTRGRIARSVGAMLGAALAVRLAVPATLQLIQVASGQLDLFWQYSQVRAGLMAGALLVAEAGGSVSDTRGHAWRADSADFLAGAPGLTGAAVAALAPSA